MAAFKVKFLSIDEIRIKAEEYLTKVHPTGSIPIPIEEIVDREGIDVVPVEGLGMDGGEAYTARDRKTIYVDREVFCHRVPYRLRFTLAHELSHILLHPYVFEAADYSTIDGFKSFWSEMPPESVKIIEDQAYKSAGRILVPSPALSTEYKIVASALSQAGFDITDLPSESLKSVAKTIGTKFQVSWHVIHRCAVRDGLWKWDDIAVG